MSFHNARFIRGELPNKLMESHSGYTGKGKLRDRNEQSQHPALSPNHRWCLHVERQTLVSSPVAIVVHRSGGLKSHRAPSVICGTAELEHWVAGALSGSPQWAEVPLISVSRWSFYQTCSFVVPSQGHSITPPYLGLGHIAT